MEEREDWFGEELAREVTPAPKPKAAPKPAPAPEPAPRDESQPDNMTEEEFAALRHDVWRMWNAEPEETR